MARVESERLNDREPGRLTRAASLLRAPVPKLLELGSGVRVGVAAVPSRVAAPGGTSGAESCGEHLCLALWQCRGLSRDESNKGGVTWRGGGRTDDYKGDSILSLLDT